MPGEIHRNYRDPATPAIDHSYSPNSLRTLVPEFWVETQMLDHRLGWINTKDILRYPSLVLGYGFGPIERRGLDRQVVSYIKDHCGAVVRFRALAISAYESFGDVSGGGYWRDITPQAFLSLSSAISTIDAFACVLWGCLFLEAPSGKKVPDFPKLIARLEKEKHPFAKRLRTLQVTSGLMKMRELRNRLVHRGFAALAHGEHGFAFGMEKGLFRERPAGLSVTTANKAHPRSQLQTVALPGLMAGFLKGIAQWETSASRLLAKHLKYRPFVNRGVMVSSTIYRDPLSASSSPSQMEPNELLTEYIDWWQARYKRRMQEIQRRARNGKPRADDPILIDPKSRQHLDHSATD